MPPCSLTQLSLTWTPLTILTGFHLLCSWLSLINPPTLQSLIPPIVSYTWHTPRLTSFLPSACNSVIHTNQQIHTIYIKIMNHNIHNTKAYIIVYCLPEDCNLSPKHVGEFIRMDNTWFYINFMHLFDCWWLQSQFIHSFIHSIGTCRMRRFLAVLRNFFHSSLLCTFSCQPSPPSILPSSLTSSCHLFLCLPLNLVVPKFIYEVC